MSIDPKFVELTADYFYKMVEVELEKHNSKLQLERDNADQTKGKGIDELGLEHRENLSGTVVNSSNTSSNISSSISKQREQGDGEDRRRSKLNSKTRNLQVVELKEQVIGSRTRKTFSGRFKRGAHSKHRSERIHEQAG